LHEACNQGSLEIAKLLVDHNADINAFGYQKNTPLHEAALHKNYDCVEFLLDKGANITLRNEAGFKARDYVKSQENFVNLFNSYASSHDLLSQNDLNQSQFNQTIGEDLNISCTFKNNRKARGAKAPKKCIIFGTGNY
jgi:ankyrin repeat protein